jgi:pimeloyl-ACP methyl ester carboxylesterase
MDKERDRVLLIHGLWMNGLELTLLRRRLRKAGFRTRRFHYPSMRASLDANSRRFVHCIESTRPRHIVAHSLGGLVTLRAFEIRPELPVERIVFMAAPVRGSSVARALMARPWGRRMLGKSGPGVLAAAHQPVWRFAPPLGVLAGTQSAGFGRAAARFAGANDGTVALAETSIDGATDHVTVNAGHMTMVASREAADQVVHFLRKAAFMR